MSDPTGAPGGAGERPTFGQWDHLESFIGKRGMGKSTFAAYRAWYLARQAGGAYVIGHSLGARLPSKLPDELGGAVLPITYHEDLDKLGRGIRRYPDRWHVLAPPLNTKDGKRKDTADDLLRYVVQLASALRKQAWQRAHPLGIYRESKDAEGVPGVPIIVIIDEGIAVEAAGHSRKEDNRWFLEFLYSLRHMHVALLYAIQDATARSWRVLEQSTAIHVFAVRHAWALQAIQAGGANEDEIERIRHLERHEHVTLSWETPSTVDIPESMRER